MAKRNKFWIMAHCGSGDRYYFKERPKKAQITKLWKECYGFKSCYDNINMNSATIRDEFSIYSEEFYE